MVRQPVTPSRLWDTGHSCQTPTPAWSFLPQVPKECPHFLWVSLSQGPGDPAESAHWAPPIWPHAGGPCLNCPALPAAAFLGCCLPLGYDPALPLLAPQVSPPLSAVTTDPGLDTGPVPVGQGEQSSAPLCPLCSLVTRAGLGHLDSLSMASQACSVAAVPSPQVQCEHLQDPGKSHETKA